MSKKYRTDFAWAFEGQKARGAKKSLITSLFLVLLLAFVVDYLTLPAYNLRNSGIYLLFAFYFGVFGILNFLMTQKFSGPSRASLTLSGLLVAFVVVMSILGSEFINAAKYRNQIVISETTDFSSSFDKIKIGRASCRERV